MLKSLSIFGSGVVVGAVGIVTTVIYVKSVRDPLVKSFAKFISEKLAKDPVLREKAVYHASNFIKATEGAN